MGVPLFRGTALPPGRTGQAKPSFGLADRSGQIAAGGVITNVGQTLQKARTANTLAEFSGEVKTAQAKLRNDIKENPDWTRGDFDKALLTMQTSVTEAAKKGKSFQEKRAITNWLAENEDLLDEQMSSQFDAIEVQREYTRLNANLDLLAEKGDVKNMQATLRNSGLVDPDTLKVVEPNLVKPVIADQALLEAAQQVDEADGLAVFDKLNADTLEDYGYKNLYGEKEIAELKAKYQRERNAADANAKKAQEVVHTQEEQSIVDKFIAKDFVGIEEFINQQKMLTPDEKYAWMQRADERANQVISGKNIVTDPRVEADLEKKALDVSTGARVRAEVMTEIIDARYGKKPTIDDAAFDSLSSTANREHKMYQANAMKEAIDYGQTQLLSKGQIEIIAAAQVSEDEDFDTILKRLGTQRRLEEDNLSEYTRAMNQWFEAEVKAGRDPDDDDIYTESRKKMVHYRNRIEELPKKAQFGKPGTNVRTGGEVVGIVDTDGKLVLNENGLLRLLRITGNDVARVREIMEERGFKEPD